MTISDGVPDEARATLAAGLAYLRAGWALTVLHHVRPDGAGLCSCGETSQGHAGQAGKHPVWPGWQQPERHIRSPDALAAALAERPHANLGLVTGPASGVWVVDVDPLHGGRPLEVLGSTRVHRTGSGGWHLVYRLGPDSPTRNTNMLQKVLGPGYDVRSGGGQIVLPPSVSGRGPYTVEVDCAPAAEGPSLLALLRAAAEAERPTVADPPPGSVTEASDGYTRQLMSGCLGWLAGAQPGTRNQVAFAVAARLWEAINAGWVGESAALTGYLAAAAQADRHGGADRFTEAEARRCWTSARRKVAGAAAVRPPAPALPDVHGGSLPGLPQAPPGPTVAPSVSVTGPEPVPAGHAPGQPSPLAAFALQVQQGGDGGTGVTGQWLPDHVWQARPALAHIRQAARSRLAGPDAVLAGVLARLASMMPPQCRVDTGVKSPASLNVFVAVVARSSGGKSTGASLAARLLARPPWLRDRGAYREGAPIGSGEGLAEAFMGIEIRADPVLDANGQPALDTNGVPKIKTRQERCQISKNALFTVDEGATYSRMLERSGATLAETLRTAWSGGTIGQSNAKSETTRIIEDGEYSLALVMGFQPDTAVPLLADEATGTAGRFLWVPAEDPLMPAEPVPDPGPLHGVWQAPYAPLLQAGDTPQPDVREWHLHPQAAAELRAWHLDAHWGRLAGLQDINGHLPLHMIKMSALLAALDGRRDIGMTDWHLARCLWVASVRMRDAIRAHGERLAIQRRQAEQMRHAELAGIGETVRLDVLHSRAEVEEKMRMGRLTSRVAAIVHRMATRPDGAVLGVRTSAVRRGLDAPSRPRVQEALDAAREAGWVALLGEEWVPALPPPGMS